MNIVCDTGRLVFLGFGAVVVVASVAAVLVTLHAISEAVRGLP